MRRYRLIAVPLFSRLRVSTDGVSGANGVYAYIDLDVPGLSELILAAEEVGLVVLQDGTSGSNNFEWNIELIGGYDAFNVVTAVPLSSSDINANSPYVARLTPITGAANFLLYSRLRLRFKNKNSLTGVQAAVLSATLLVKTVSQ